MMAAKKPDKPYWEMTLQELQEATAEFDREFIADEFKPLTPEMRRRWERAKRKCPSASGDDNGRAKRSVSISLDQDLLDRLDRTAAKRGVSRSALVQSAIRAQLGGRRRKAS